MERIKVDEVWQLQLIRNADFVESFSPVLTEDGKEAISSHTQANSEYSQFFAFEFDKLICKSGHALIPRDCLCLNNWGAQESPPSIASQGLTLLSLVGEKKEEDADPFFYQAERREFSDMPFLSLILVTIKPKEVVSNNVPPHTSESEVSAFLRSCAAELRSLAETACSAFFNERNLNNDTKLCRVLHSVNSGHFCIALRTQHPELCYYLATKVRGSILNKEKQYDFPSVQCSTFTITCVEYKESGSLLSKEIAEKINCKVAVRLTLDNEYLYRLLKKSMEKDAGHQESGGLFGRYDIVLTLTMTQFCELYPYICRPIFSTSFDIDGQAVSDQTIALLKETLQKPGTRCINESLLIVDPVSSCLESFGHDSKLRAKIEAENLTIANSLEELRTLGYELPYYQREYNRCLTLLKELWRSYSSLRSQDDSIINGNVFLSQISFLLKQIKQYIQNIPKGSRLEQFYRDLTVNMRRAIDSISRFQKLMQAINQQSLQSPNYDVQLNTDLEKYVVAYTEFSRRFLAEHFRKEGANPNSDDKQRILPLVAVDTRNESILAQPLFLLPYHMATETDPRRRVSFSNTAKEWVMLPIILPDIDTLGSLYTTLPLICHELSHNFRVISRKDRNDALIRFIFHKVAAYTVRSWISRASDRSIYYPFGRIQDHLTDCMADCLERYYRKYYGSAHEQANIGVILNNILFFLENFVFIDHARLIRRSPELGPKTIRAQLEELAQIYQRTGDLRNASWYKQYITSIRESKEIEKSDSNDKLSVSDEAQKGNSLERMKLFEQMLSAIVNDQLSLLRSAIDDFEDFVDTWLQQEECSSEDEKLEPKHRREILRKVKSDAERLCNDQRLVQGYLQPQSVEDWIESVYNELILPCKSLSLPIFPKHRALFREYGNYERYQKSLVRTAQACCRTIKDACHAGTVLINLCYSSPVYTSPSEELIEDFHRTLRMRLRGIQQMDGVERILYEAEQVQGLLTPLGIDLKDGNVFARTLKSVLVGTISIDSVEKLVQDSATLYREVFADLGMCAALGLTSFGYLMVLSHSKVFCEGCLVSTDSPSSQNIERMRTVCWVMESRNDSHAFEKLDERCRKYYEEMVERLRNSLLPSEPPQLFQDFCEALKNVMVYPGKARSIQRMPNMQGIAPHLQSKVDFFDFQQDMEALWYTIQFCSHMRCCELYNINAELRQHFSDLYHSILCPHWKKSETENPNSGVLSKIGDAYSQGKLSTTGAESSKEMLSFVLYYYYHAWKTYSGDCGVTEIDQCLERLTGGEASV